MTLLELEAKLTLDTKEFEKAMKKAGKTVTTSFSDTKVSIKQSTDEIDKGLKNTSSNAEKASKGIKGFFKDMFNGVEGSTGAKVNEWLGGMGDMLSAFIPSAVSIAKGAFDALKKAIELAHDSYMEFESAFTGVIKTVDAPAEKLDEIKNSILELSTEIPSTTTEIAGVAEAAGQLGVAADDIMNFTEVMINLGNATNLSAEEAATSLARLSNIMGTGADEYSNLGSAIVGLGNNFATTEREIVDMATNMASTAAVIGLTTPEVLALSTAMSSLGIEAAAGGTSVSKVFKSMQQAVSDGGASLKKFAEAAGMTASAFSELWAESPMKAFQAFIDGLAEIKNNGGDTLKVLSDLELTEVRTSNTVLALVQGHEMLADAVNLSNQAWQENAALIEEAAKRYGTLESEEKKAQNAWKRMWTVIGEDLAPVSKAVAHATKWMWNEIADVLENETDPDLFLKGQVGGRADYDVKKLLEEGENKQSLENAIDNFRDRMTDKMGDYFEDHPVPVDVVAAVRVSIDEKLESAGDQLFSQLMKELGYTGYKRNEEGDWERFDNTSEYMEKVTNNASQMTNAFSQLNTGTKENVLSFEDMLANMKANSEAMQSWGDNMLDLNTRLGQFDGGNIILEQLKQMGVEGSAQVAELVAMTDEQLQELAENASKNAHIAFTVTMELEGATEAEVELQKTIDTLQRNFDDYTKLFQAGMITEEELKELTSPIEEQLRSLTDAAGVTVASVAAELDEAQAEANAKVQEFGSIGEEIMGTIAGGIETGGYLLSDALVAKIQDAIDAAYLKATGEEPPTASGGGGNPYSIGGYPATPSTIGYPGVTVVQHIDAPKSTPSEVQREAVNAFNDYLFTNPTNP